MTEHWILDAKGEPVPAELMEWARWFETGNRILGQDKIGDVLVSTVFLGLDHSFGDGPPLLWETMIFGGKHEGYQERYSTKAEAQAGHSKALALAREVPCQK